MKKRGFILMAGLIAALLPGVVGCTNEASSIATPETTPAGFEEGQVLDVGVGLSLQTSLARGVSFENVEVLVGILDRTAMNPWKGGTYSAGDYCLRVLGDIRNDTDEDLVVSAAVTGYDPAWEEVAWTLSASRIVGVAEFSVAGQTTGSFEIILSWAGDVRYIEIRAESFDESLYHVPGIGEEL